MEAQRKGLELVSNELKSKVVSGTELGVRFTIKACEPLEPKETAPAVAPGFMSFPGEDSVQH